MFAFVSLSAAIANAADPPPPAAPAVKPAADAKKIDWAKMTVAEKKKHMKTVVLPSMKKLFVEFDAKHYKSMTCATCHGKKAAVVKFKMPSAELPKLPQPTDREGFMALQQKKPEVAKFMGTKVKPTMASLLSLEEWEPNKPNGFGCYNCHTKEEAKAGAVDPAAVRPPTGTATKPAAPGGGKPGEAPGAKAPAGGSW